MRTLKVGDIVKLKVDMFGNPEGTEGVVIDEYTLGELSRVQIIFENGEYDGFSDEEQRAYLERSGHEASLADYKFTNVMKLSQDFEEGKFDAVFN